MNVKSIFFKAIALCAILILSSCQSKEEKVISRMNDLAEQIEKNGELDNWDDIDRVGIATEYALILKDMQNCEFTNEQQIELFKACKNVSVAFGSISGNGLPEGMEDMLKGMDSMLDGMKAYSDGLDESDEVSEDENKDVDKEEDVVLPKVYSNCFDGYLNVRAEPSSKSKILGTLPNGPEGAELLGVDGKWSKVRVNGVVGYVWSADVQSTPTEPVFISASDVVGEWLWADENAHMNSYTIESNGKFEAEGWCVSRSGTWYLSRNKLVLKDSDGEVTTCTVNDNAIKIDGLEYYRYEE